MKFGAIPIAECAGAILAHSLKMPKGVFKKGRVLSAADADALAAAGLRTVVAARLEPDEALQDVRLAVSFGLPPSSPKPPPGTASGLPAPSPAAPTCWPRCTGLRSSTALASTGSIKSTKR